MRRAWRYEHKDDNLLPLPVFRRRMLLHFGVVLALLVVSVGGGMLGFHALAHYAWVDAFLDSAMLLGGMGPTGPDLPTSGAKLFAGFYALYCGLVFIATAALLLAPVIHRIMHRLHWRQD